MHLLLVATAVLVRVVVLLLAARTSVRSRRVVDRMGHTNDASACPFGNLVFVFALVQVRSASNERRSAASNPLSTAASFFLFLFLWLLLLVLALLLLLFLFFRLLLLQLLLLLHLFQSSVVALDVDGMDQGSVPSVPVELVLFGALSPVALVVDELGRVANGIGLDLLHASPQRLFGLAGIVLVGRNLEDCHAGLEVDPSVDQVVFRANGLTQGSGRDGGTIQAASQVDGNRSGVRSGNSFLGLLPWLHVSVGTGSGRLEHALQCRSLLGLLVSSKAAAARGRRRMAHAIVVVRVRKTPKDTSLAAASRSSRRSGRLLILSSRFQCCCLRL